MINLTRGNRFASGFGNRDYLADYLAGREDELTPAVNIAENDKQFRIEMGLPGFSRDDFNVDLENNCLTISGEKKAGTNVVKDEYTRYEFGLEKFEKSFELPENADTGKIDAKFKEGLLQIEIPKKSIEKYSPKKIKVH